MKNFSIHNYRVYAVTFIVLFAFLPVYGQPPVYTIIIKEHKFIPENLSVPANQKIKLLIRNNDATPEEFESYDFNREKIVPGNSEITVFIGPLKPGVYHYFGEFHPDTAKGTITVKEGAP